MSFIHERGGSENARKNRILKKPKVRCDVPGLPLPKFGGIRVIHLIHVLDGGEHIGGCG
jgi:hypothetical protein